MPWVGKGSYNIKYYKHALFYWLFFTEVSQCFDECLKTLKRMIDIKKQNKTWFSPLDRNSKICYKEYGAVFLLDVLYIVLNV